MSTTAKLHVTPDQGSILRHPARVKVAVCGRRWGKTILMAMALVKAACEFPGSRSWYIANDYGLALAQMRMMKRNPDFMKLVAHPVSQFPPRFEMKNGSEIAFRSADRPDLLLGAGLRLIAHDEAARSSKDLFWRVLMPMLTDTRGTMLCGSTYAGRNWFYNLAELGKKYDPSNPTNDFIKTWVYPTRTGISFQGLGGAEELERLRAQYPPMVWSQEFECEPLATIDAVFMYVDQCIVNTLPLPPQRCAQYIVSQDIGRTYDPSAVIVIDKAGNVCHAEVYPLGMLHAEQAKRTLATAQRFNCAQVVLDTTGGASGGKSESHIREYLHIIPNAREITHNQTEKRNMVNRLALDFETKKVSIPAQFKELIAQLKLYRYKIGEFSVNPQFGAEKNGHDDLVAALYQATWAREKNWFRSNGAGLGAVIG